MARNNLYKKYKIIAIQKENDVIDWKPTIFWQPISKFVKQGETIVIQLSLLENTDNLLENNFNTKASQFVSTQTKQSSNEPQPKHDVFPTFTVKQSTILTKRNLSPTTSIPSSKIRRLLQSVDCKHVK